MILRACLCRRFRLCLAAVPVVRGGNAETERLDTTINAGVNRHFEWDWWVGNFKITVSQEFLDVGGKEG